MEEMQWIEWIEGKQEEEKVEEEFERERWEKVSLIFLSYSKHSVGGSDWLDKGMERGNGNDWNRGEAASSPLSD